jgi:flagellar hook-associated protein FlgK
LENVKFKAAWKDYNDTTLKEDIQEAAEEVGNALSKGFGGLMSLGKKVAKKIEKKVEEAVEAV